MNKVVVFAFSKKGRELGQSIGKQYPDSIFIYDFKEKSLHDHVGEWFTQYNILIFVGALGIAVRGIAPFLKGKDVDPAVLVVDELGTFVIPLLSGHLGGANHYGVKLAKALEATVVLTTATDINKVFAVDVWAKEQNLFIHNIDQIKYISSAVLSGNRIGLSSDYEIDTQNVELEEGMQSGILIAESYRSAFPHTLWLEPKRYILGVGCRKSMDSVKFETQLLAFLAEYQIPIHLVGRIASIHLKEKEEAIVAFARKYGIEFITYTSEQLLEVEGDFEKSEFVQSVTGVDNVCERSAVLASGAKEAYIPKTIREGMTMSVSIQSWQITGLDCINQEER